MTTRAASETLDALDRASKCKLPAYTAHDPLLWFRAVDAAFLIYKVVKPELRAAHVVAALPEKQLQAVGHLLADLNADSLYDALRQRLLEVDGPTFQTSMERCLAIPVIRGGERPTDVLRQLVSWLDKDLAEHPFMRAIFLTKMPADVKKILLGRSDLGLHDLAVFADSIQAVGSACSPPVFQVASASDEPVCVVRKASAPSPPSAPGPCWYHANHGANAKKCKPGCTWVKVSGNGTRLGQ